MDKVILILAIISILFGVSQQAKLERSTSALDIELEEDTDSVEFLGKKASVENIFKDIFHIFDGKREEIRTKRAAYSIFSELAGPTTVPSTTNQHRKRPKLDYGPKAGYCQGRLFCK